jgi:hypothetical protein
LTTPENLAALRQARIAIERAADPLNAEPPAHALSAPAYDSKSGLFAVFGGDHFDYLLNDLWIFDPKAERWEQRHPLTPAPEPRAEHIFSGDGTGKFTVRGGYGYARRNPLPKGWNGNAHSYAHAGVGDWVYDLATNRWTGPEGAETAPADTRAYRTQIHAANDSPDHFTTGPRPNAAEHEKRLKDLPANTWIDITPSIKFAGNRDWGTLAYDAGRGQIYFYNGGHSAYGGNDVAHYHLATDRWDQPIEVEFPLMYVGASGVSLSGWSFNRRPWMTNHLWNSYTYHPELDRLILAGRFTSSGFSVKMGQPDVNLYFYDPALGDWEKRVPSNVAISHMSAQVRHVPGFGLLEWNRSRLDPKTLAWEPLAIESGDEALPKASIDYCGLVYDGTRKRMLYFSGGGYDGKPYPGEVHVLELPSLKPSSFTPAGSEHIATLTSLAKPRGSLTLREVVHHPGLDLFVFNSNLANGDTLALDAKNNRWVGLKLPGKRPFGLSSANAYDAKRDLVYAIGTRAEVSVVRLDPKTLTIRPLAEIVAEAAK